MATIGAMNVNVSEIARDLLTVEIKVTGAKVFKWRLWIAAQIIKLAQKVSGLKFEVDIKAN